MKRISALCRHKAADGARVEPCRVAAARELRDRYLERINNDPYALPAPNLKYDISRQIEAGAARNVHLLPPVAA